MTIRNFEITADMLKELDAMYEETEDMGVLGRRRTRLEPLVEELRKIRQLVESGVTVTIEGTDTVLRSWESFYSWAHGRYHILEDGSNKWIGDDAW